MNVDGKKKKSGAGAASTPRTDRSNDVEWYNPQPNSADVKWLEDKRDSHGQQVAELVSGLYVNQRLSIKLDLKTSRWIAILFDDPTTHDGVVHALSCRASSGFNALVLLHYFHMVKFKEGWKQDNLQSTSDFG